MREKKGFIKTLDNFARIKYNIEYKIYFNYPQLCRGKLSKGEIMKTCPTCGRQFDGRFCPGCGTLAAEDASCPACGVRITGSPKFCPNCGHSFDTATPSNQSNSDNGVYTSAGANMQNNYTPGTGYSQYNGGTPTPKQTNGLAIAGFILSFIFSFIGLILSIVGLVKAKDYGGSGKGLAIAGIIISIIMMILSIMIQGMLEELLAEFETMSSIIFCIV